MAAVDGRPDGSAGVTSMLMGLLARCPQNSAAGLSGPDTGEVLASEAQLRRQFPPPESLIVAASADRAGGTAQAFSQHCALRRERVAASAVDATRDAPEGGEERLRADVVGGEVGRTVERARVGADRRPIGREDRG